MHPRHHSQQDLFKEDRSLPEMPTQQRSLVVGLITGLLVEAIGSDSEASAAITETTEVAHEQDHA
jgi:hypothetical protein